MSADARRADDLTNGYLPVAAFEHLGATQMGLVDLDGPPTIRLPNHSAAAADPSDGLLLVRLHGDPLAVIHVQGPRLALQAEELGSLIWQQASGAIAAHVERYGCVEPPALDESLFGACAAPTGACLGAICGNRLGPASVVIPTGGRPDQLGRCLRSLLALERPKLEFLVVDNRPDLPETRRLAEAIAVDDARVRYVAEPRPGSSVARNRGIAEVSSEFVAFTDDDVVIDAEWLNWLLSPFAEPEVTAVTGMVLPLELRTEAQKRFEQYAGFSKGVTGRSYDLHAARDDGRVLYPYWGGVFGSGNSMAFRTAELAAAGGFDPALGAGSLALAGADIEAFSAAILRGGRLVYEPRALCWHEHRRDDGALKRQLFNYGVGFTAILTKYLLNDRRFLRALGRSVPLAVRRRRGGGEETAAASLPGEYASLVRSGMLRGPRLYVKSRHWARRLSLDEAIVAARPPQQRGGPARGTDRPGVQVRSGC
ncbi:MAG: glycosyl transferase family 2 [Solirubrobacterales bacterium]|nr:glycosyl transferase family 2 [Solirubrobacterales bacterium]